MSTEYAIEVTLASGRTVVECIRYPMISPGRSIPSEMLRMWREANQNPVFNRPASQYVGATFSLLRREVPDFEDDETYVTPMDCLQKFGSHDFEGDYASWTSLCTRCFIYQ